MPDAETFQHYQVLRKEDGALHELGRGAMGVTYKAFDTNLRCHVALKVINAAYLDSDMARQRFLREARAAAGLSHPNVASVFHLGEEGGNYFYAMEFIDGETLEAFVRRHGPLPPAPALRIALQVARALRAAAKEGLVHRDIKPANLMLLNDEDDDESVEGERHVKVIDFGLAKMTRKEDGEASATITVAGFVGTPHFASPEQLEEKDLDVRSDMYSLGVTLWYMLTGRPTFAGSMVQIMSQHLTRPPSLENLAGQPPEVVHLLSHLLEKDPAKRPQTPSDLRREIEQVIVAIGARAAGPAAPGAAEVETYATEAATNDFGLASDQPITSPPPATGVVLDGRFRLLREVARSSRGTLFQALELDTGRPVAVKVLAPGFFPNAEALEAAQREVDRARLAPHPNLLKITALETLGLHTALIYEWVNGFTLLDVLRTRHELPAAEALRLLEPLAAAVDHARSHKLANLDLSLSETLVAFDAAQDPASRTALLGEPLATWPAHGLKLFPLSLASGVEASATWAGAQTVAPAPFATPNAIRQLALVTCELLGGAAGQSPSPGTTQRLRPLAALSEEGNAVLQRALAPKAAPAFASAGEFVHALAATLGAAPAPPVAPRPKPAPVPPPPAPPQKPAPPASRRGLLIALSLAVIFIFLGAVGGAAYFAWKRFVRPADKQTVLAEVTPSPAPTPEPTATPSPSPTPTPAPTVSKDAQFKADLAEATRLENVDDQPAALAAYVRLAQQYPEQDPGASRVDSYVSALRAKALSPEDEDRRFARLRASLEQAAEVGSEMAMFYLGARLVATDPPAAAGWYQKAADKGLPEAMMELGNLYFNGRGVPMTPSKASFWYARASDKGFVKAKVYLAECYDLGKGGLAVDHAKAFALLSEALTLEPNNPVALEKLAIEYEKGQGAPPNARQAFAMMKHAAELGNANALGNLGVYYMNGLENGQPNPRLGAATFKEGAEKNNPFCMTSYARCLEKGLGVRANRAEAVGFYRAAAQRGYPPARQWCRENNVTFADQ